MKHLDDFLNHITLQRRYSKRTAELYKDAVCRFYSSALGLDCGSGALVSGDGCITPGEELELISVSNIRSFIASGIDEGLSERSVNLRISALSSFCNYLVKGGVLKSNPVKKVYRPKEKRKLPDFYQKDIIARYIEEPYGEEYSDVRNRLIVIMLYATGMRRSEIVGLKLEDYDSARSLFRITGKGDKMREIPVIPFLSEKIALYLHTRMSSFPDCNNSSFFLTDRGETLYLGFVNNVVGKELAAFKGLGGKLTPHILRHSLATHLLNDGAGLSSIKEILGHSSLAATQVYTHNSFEQLKTIYITAHPRAKKRR